MNRIIIDLHGLKSKNYITLSQDKLDIALNLMNKEQLQFISDMIDAHQQVNMKTIKPTKKCVDNRRILCKIYLKII